MTRLKFPLASIGLSLLTAVCCIPAFAQQDVALNATPVRTIYFRNVSLNDPERSGQPFSTTVTGAIKGRVLNDVYAVPSVEPQAVGGARVILRSIENGVATIVGHRITESNGKYEFPNLPAARYSIEVDPISIPVSFRSSGVIVSPIRFEPSSEAKVKTPATELRTIKGIVFIDKDGDGQYKPGKDKPVSGAYITANGRFAVSDDNGSYILSELPAGRTNLLASTPSTNDNTHMVLDLSYGSGINRVVNVPIYR